MIRVVSRWEEDLRKYSSVENYGAALGDGLLLPTKCTVSETAGGDYSLQLEHPIDPEGRWRMIEPFVLICAPIPPAETPFIDQESGSLIGVGMDVYLTTASTSLYSSTVNAYRAWVSGEGYYPGDRVSYGGYNWECLQITYITPSTSASAWRRLNQVRQVIKVLPADTTLIVSEPGSTWLHVTLLDGTTGYVRVGDAAYQYTIEEGDAILDDCEPRQLDHQLFRVTQVQIDGARGTLSATAQHVSYDYTSALVGTATFKSVPLASAVAGLRSAMLPDGASSAPRIYAETSERTITAACTHRSLTSVLLDPETGFVAQARAKLVRDARDFFLLQDAEVDRGYAIRYGVNLTGVTWRRDTGKIITRVLPIAKTSSGADYTLPVTSGETWPYVDSPRRSEVPVDAYEILAVDAKIGTDGTEAQVQARMVEEAEARFSTDQADLPVTTLTVDFLLLGDTEEYAQYKGLERLSLYDTVQIVHPDIGLSTRAQVKSYEWDALAKRYTRITLGDPFAAVDHTVYGYSVADGAITARKLTPEAIAEIRGS